MNTDDAKFIDIVFAEQPGRFPDYRFVEVEDETGKSIKLGEWIKRPDGYYAIRFYPSKYVKMQAETKMSEKDAWLYLSDCVLAGSADSYGRWWFKVEGVKGANNWSCLCTAVGDILVANDVRKAMQHKLEIEMLTTPRLFNGYLYPTNEEGAKQRAELCKRMARECR